MSIKRRYLPLFQDQSNAKGSLRNDFPGLQKRDKKQ